MTYQQYAKTNILGLTRYLTRALVLPLPYACRGIYYASVWLSPSQIRTFESIQLHEHLHTILKYKSNMLWSLCFGIDNR